MRPIEGAHHYFYIKSLSDCAGCPMGRDTIIGVCMIVLSISIIITYGWIVFFTEWSTFLLQLTGFIAVAGVFGVLAFIGYVLVRTPPPKPIEEMEESLKDLEGSES
jgi:predicted DNA-binding transcriptional regulator